MCDPPFHEGKYKPVYIPPLTFCAWDLALTRTGIMSTSEIQDAAKAEPKANDPVAAKAFVSEDEGEKSWKIHDEQILPKNNLPLVFFSLLLATFLVRI